MRNLVTILLLSLPIYLLGQAMPKIDKRLYDVFDATHLKNLQQKTPFNIHYYNFFLDNSYQIVSLAKDKSIDTKSIMIPDLNNINILKLQKQYALKRAYDRPTYYKITNTNKLLVFLPEKEFIKKLNQHLGRVR